LISGRDNHTNFSLTTNTNLYNCIIAEMDVLRRSARKSRMERIKNEQIKEIIRVKGKPDIIDIIEKKRLQCYGHVKTMPEERI
jgi:hypothetical protein